MTLEAVVFQQDSFNNGCRDIYALGAGGTWSYGLGLKEDKVYFEKLGNNVEQVSIANLESLPSSMVQGVKERDANTASPDNCTITDRGFLAQGLSLVEAPAAATMGRRKRRRIRRTKNKEEMENQRMTHIAVERNRRKQMNDYLTVLKSMMPASYVQRGDQASILGGAINFVKELEQLLQSMEAQKGIKQRLDNSLSSGLFSGFFTLPQYTCSNESSESMMEKRSAIADIEVTMVESHANIKILSRKHPKQLLKMVAALQSLHLIVLHLNVTTVDNMVLCSFSVKVEDDSKLTSVNEIAAAVYEMVGWIQKEVQFA
ncbi:transcription factor bHLH94-like [Quercus robur]|uniref:transcription factor bHLH94-like n=1 Tax=Quercus robur TaxID=38942 RepID=UPI0021622E65|nr:transcription factor bHLH94-like [Quercus robur]